MFEFVSPADDKKWKFDLQHVVTRYEMGARAGFGMSGFTNRVVGGEVGGVQYEDRGHSEQTYWPEHIEQWKIWLVWGFGFLGKGNHMT